MNMDPLHRGMDVGRRYGNSEPKKTGPEANFDWSGKTNPIKTGLPGNMDAKGPDKVTQELEMVRAAFRQDKNTKDPFKDQFISQTDFERWAASSGDIKKLEQQTHSSGEFTQNPNDPLYRYGQESAARFQLKEPNQKAPSNQEQTLGGSWHHAINWLLGGP